MSNLPSYYESLDSPLPLPRYSQHTPNPSLDLSLPHLSSPCDFIVSSQNISLNLGPKLYKTQFPCYPHNGIIQGHVRLASLKHVRKLKIKFSGSIVNNVTERGLTTGHSQTAIVLIEQDLLSTTSSPRQLSPDAANGYRFDFSIPIPSYIQGAMDPLPPSFVAYHPRYSSQIAYQVKVSMHKSGLRLNESVQTQVFYLPASCSELPVPSLTPSMPEISLKLCASHQQLQSTDITMALRLHTPKIYPAGSCIPFALLIKSTTSSLLAQLLIQNIVVEYVRYITLFVEGYRSCRESIIGRGQVTLRERRQDGAYNLEGTVSGGKQGGESSWSVAKMIDVRYVLRFVVPDACRASVPLLPSFRHDEPIVITSHASGHDEEYGSLPAIGMLSPSTFQQDGLSQLPSAAQYMTLR